MNVFRSNVGTLNEILFEKKNKMYGAYAIRAAYGSTVFKSLGIVSTIMIGFVWLLSIAMGKPIEVKIPDVPDPDVITKIITVDLDKPAEQLKPATEHKTAAAAMSNTALTQFVIRDQPADSVKIAVNDPINSVGTGSTSLSTETTSIGPGTSTTSAGTETVSTSGEPFKIVEVYPSLPGGLPAFWAKNIRYPNQAREANVEGRVVVNFIIDEEGNLDRCEFVQKLGYGCDEEVLRVVKLMPKWKPGMMNNKPVKVSFKQAIQFKLQ